MEKIVIMSRGRRQDRMFIRIIQLLFPECEVCVVFPDHYGSAMGKMEQEIISETVH